MLLMMSGFGWEPEREEQIDSVTAKEPKCFENQQVKIWCGFIQWSLGAKSVVVYDPDYTQVLSGTVHGGVEPERLKSIQASFRAHLDRYERHIFPICSWSANSIEHWTLLVLDLRTKEVRYYETLEEMKKGTFEAASRIHKLVADRVDELKRVNHLRQLGVECGEALCHYVELEVRQAIGEGWGSVRGFTQGRRRQMRVKLGSTAGMLQKVQVGWKERLAQEELKQKQMQALKDAALGKANRLQQEIKEIEAVQRKHATECFWDGEDHALELPEGFGVRNKLAKSTAKPKAKSMDITKFKAELEAAAAKKKKDEEEAEEQKKIEEDKAKEKKDPKKKEQNDEEKGEKKDEKDEKKDEKKEEEERKKAEDDDDVKVIVPEVDPLEYKAEEILKKGQKGFEKWVKGLSIEKLEEIVKVEEGEKEGAKARGEYLTWVQEHESLKVCSSCRWQHGCETCSYEHALRYVVRHRQPARWWLRRRGEVLRATKVFDAYKY